MLLAALLPGVESHLSAQTIITPDPDSKIWIEGNSNVNRFTCAAEKYRGEARIYSESLGEIAGRADEQVRLELNIPVRSFECGRSRMNRDLYDALKSDEFFYITFEFQSAETLSGNGNDSFRLKVSGILTVAGTSREITFESDGFILENNRVRAVGDKTILMTDYNVEPPTGLLGLVRAENSLTVHFDLYASPTNRSEIINLQR
jgi:hypothetical protein